jgi:pimeloyl-ACP methyl ester carboxylesterase
MNLELVQFPNTNNILLPGLLFEPVKASNKVLISLHGNGSSGGMYSVKLKNIYGKKLTDKGISFLTFTNTGGHLIQKFDLLKNGGKDRVKIGVAYELIKDCINDIDGAIKFVEKRGYKHIYLVGRSTGANKVCVYNYYKSKNPIERYILESGGDDSGLFYSDMGDKEFKRMLTKCKDKIKKGEGWKLIPESVNDSPISYQSFFDQINPDGDYNIFPFYWLLNKVRIMKKKPWREIQSIKIPSLVVYGGKDEYCCGRVNDCVDLIRESVSNKRNFQFTVIPGADHGYFGKEELLADKVVKFLTK